MRVTQNMISSQFLRNVQKNYENVGRYQSQIASGKALEKASDNPIGTVQAMNIRSSLTQMEQFKQNAQDGLTWMEATDNALEDITSVLQRVRELAMFGNNGTQTQEDRRTIAIEVNSLKEHIATLANTTVGDRYIFAGTDTYTAPFQDGEFISTNTEPLQWKVGQGVNVKVNINGKSVFGQKMDGMDLFQTLDAITAKLQNGESPDGLLKQLDAQYENVITQRTILGSNMQRLEMAVNRLDNMSLTAEKALAETEDVDMAKAISDLTNQETIMRATLSAGSRIFQTSLLEFLR
jgi:flagellar hook-associated protein 3 FlgL